MEGLDTADIEQETPVKDVFIAPSIHDEDILLGTSYTHHSPTPKTITENALIECVLGVDEAGRGPVLGWNTTVSRGLEKTWLIILGPMVYGLLYLPLASHRSLLAEAHHFDDSKVLTPAVRSSLMQTLCTPGTELYHNCGWATRVMSARDISAGMLKPAGTYNLNAQAMDATIELIKDVFAKGVNVTEIYIDTIGSPSVYQKKLERIFPTTMITVAKKADSLYPCVSAASVCAKVTRDAALEVCYRSYRLEEDLEAVVEGWGSGYPSDGRCTTWLKRNMDTFFGWGSECRFSWGTAKDLLETKASDFKIDWPTPENDEQAMRVTDFFVATTEDDEGESSELSSWFSRPVTEAMF
ncbi:hypothetical protein MMC27_007685 [Xylographa pallens]|nr:hypothetical protein [Xylographa pallens]